MVNPQQTKEDSISSTGTPVITFLDTSISRYLTHRKSEHHLRVVQEIQSLSGIKLRTDTTIMTPFLILELLGIKIEDQIFRKIALFNTPIIKTDADDFASYVPSEVRRAEKHLRKCKTLSRRNLRKKFYEHIHFQSEIGKRWLKEFLYYHLKTMRGEKLNHLINKLAIELTISRNVIGFSPQEIGKCYLSFFVAAYHQNGEMYLTTRSLDKAFKPMAELLPPNTIMTDFGGKSFQEVSSKLPMEKGSELVDGELTQSVLMGHVIRGVRYRVIAFTCESEEKVIVRLKAAIGFILFTKDIHLRDFTLGTIYLMNNTTFEIIKKIDITEVFEEFKANSSEKRL